jgi:hypothetical protein
MLISLMMLTYIVGVAGTLTIVIRNERKSTRK